ncbi:hypothetical protein ACIBL3_02375 [Kribbella sp. NPDC050124]
MRCHSGVAASPANSTSAVAA